MARDVQLIQLLRMLRSEMRDSTAVSQAPGNDATERHMLARAQRQLWLEWTWPHLQVKTSIALEPGQRFYPFPAGLTDVGILEIRPSWRGSRYEPITLGIGQDEYACFDPDLEQYSSPVVRYDYVSVDYQPRIEVWPVPDAEHRLDVLGKRELRPLVNDADTCDLDADVIVLVAASELLAADKAADARAKADAAQRMLALISGSSGKHLERCTVGAGRRPGPPMEPIRIRRV